ncbi:MAG: glycosyltransferase family 4 protein [Prevotella sp.]|nr:glycosyltransferase family 4 protein [Prevotella sp.]
MRIALLSQYFKPEMGAPQNRLYEMMKGLQALGQDVCVVTGMPNYPTGTIFEAYKNKFTYQEDIDGIPAKRYWLYTSVSRKAVPRIINMLSFSMTALFALRYLRSKHPDYIVVESPPLMLCLTAWFLCKLTGAKLVTNVSDLWPLSAVELGAIGENGLPYKVLAAIESFAYKHSLFCMGQSEEIVEFIKAHGAKDVYLFRNGVDPARFEGLHKDTQTEKLCIVYAGLLGYAQGIAGICKNINFKEIGAEFHIYGAGGEKSQIEEYIANHKDNGIFYHGSVDSKQIPGILVNADISLIPLVKNIFGAVPSKIYESMAAGIPILFSGEGEGQRIVQNNDIGWTVPAKDYQQMKEVINSIVQHPETIKAKSSNCRDCASKKFNRPKQVAALKDYLEQKLK